MRPTKALLIVTVSVSVLLPDTGDSVCPEANLSHSFATTHEAVKVQRIDNKSPIPGIENIDGKIIIDTAKISAYLEKVGRDIEKEINITEKRLSEEDSGIKSRNGKIIIDKNKTEIFIKNLSEIMGNFGAGVIRSIEEAR